jgi:hypothetical protein
VAKIMDTRRPHAGVALPPEASSNLDEGLDHFAVLEAGAAIIEQEGVGPRVWHTPVAIRCVRAKGRGAGSMQRNQSRFAEFPRPDGDNLGIEIDILSSQAQGF